MIMKKQNNNEKGIAPIIVAVIVGLVLIFGGAVYFALFKESPEITKKDQLATQEEKKTESEKSVEGISVDMPSFDLSASPLPDLDSSAFNVSSSDLPGGNVFSDISVNTDFSPNVDTSIKTPEIQLNITAPVVQQPPSGQQPTPSGSQQPQVDCSQFSAAPYCSYVGAPGSQSYDACKQCFPNK